MSSHLFAVITICNITIAKFSVSPPPFLTFILQCPFGIFVHPSGVEQPFHQCIDSVARLYGDKKEHQFRVWVDRVSSAQIGSDTWLVKFYKWESFGEICLISCNL